MKIISTIFKSIIVQNVIADMKKAYFLIIVVACFSGCRKDDGLMVDDRYPTTIEENSPDVTARLRSEFAQANPNMITSINSFGFCSHSEIPQSLDFDAENSPTNTPFSRAPLDLVNDFLLINKVAAGVGALDSGQIGEVIIRPFRDAGDFSWSFSTNSQWVDSLEVLKTNMTFRGINNTVTWCVGNWYPEIYIPSEFNVSQDFAKSALIDREVTHYGLGGEYKVTVTKENLSRSDTRLVIYPMESNGKIEIRVAWEINVPSPGYYLFFIDVMTGEIIASGPTIIS